MVSSHSELSKKKTKSHAFQCAFLFRVVMAAYTSYLLYQRDVLCGNVCRCELCAACGSSWWKVGGRENCINFYCVEFIRGVAGFDP